MEKFIDDYFLTVYSAVNKLKNIREEDSVLKSVPGKWSSKEILGHLIDSSINNIKRIVNGQIQDSLVFDGYNQNEWVRIQNYQNQDWNFIIDLWKLNNLHLIRTVMEIPHDVLTKNFSKHNFDKILMENYLVDNPVNLEQLIRDYLKHIKHHLKQIYMLNNINVI